MAGKGRRAASRQAQLNRKRKKTQKGPSGIPATTQTVVADTDMEEPVAVAVGADDAALEAEGSEGSEGSGAVAGSQRSAEATEVRTSNAPAARRAPRPSPVARASRGETSGQNQSRLRGERPAAYLYVGAELRRILSLTGVILIALVVLGVVL